jgi:soluble lytic murein transglycosylase
VRLVRSIVFVLIFAAFCAGAPVVTNASDAGLSKHDLKTLKTVLGEVTKKKWRSARSKAKRLQDPLAKKIVRYFDLERQGTPASFEELSSFISQNSHWPSMKRLKRRAEEAMKDSLAPETILKWFDGTEPVSTEGWIQYVRALMASGDKDHAQKVIRETWIMRNFSKRPEKSFYKRYRRFLTAEDHLKRLDRLLWEGKNWPVRRMLWKVSKKQRALAEARLMLRHRFGNVDMAISKVSRELLNDPGLTYERLRWRRSKGRYEQSVELLIPPPDNLVRPDLWWKERAYLARMALQKGHITDAYKLARSHELKEGSGFADAEWLAGWIALRFMDEPKTAFTHFQTMYEYVKYPISRARGAYWTARAAKAMDKKDAARMWFRIASKMPTTYYGQLAAAHLGPGHGLLLPVQPDPDTQEIADFEKLDLVRAVEILSAIGEQERLKYFVLALNDYRNTTGWHTLTARLSADHGRLDIGITIAKRSSRQGEELIEAGYPALEAPPLRIRSPKFPLEVPLVMAMIRQESAFYVRAQSHANARGLMQILPRTARRVARSLKIRYSKNRLSTDPVYNMTLGQAYLAGLIDEFDGSYVLALAGYNAGPARARRWARLNGNPRERTIDTIDWIEMIPFNETRNYVQRVLENLQVYRLKLADAEVAETLEQDLIR